MYTKEDFDEAILWIRQRGRIDKGAEGKAYSENTIQKFHRQMYTIISVAAGFRLCCNFLWGTLFALSEEDQKIIHTEHKLRRSLSIWEEIALFNYLIRDPMCSGQTVGVLLCSGFGLRDAESAGAKWEDIRPMRIHKEINELWIDTSIVPNSNILQSGGKTDNMGRIIFVADRVYRFLMERKKDIQAELRAAGLDDNIDKWPIACYGTSYDRYCTAKQIAETAKEIFRQIGVDGRVLAILDAELNSGEHDIQIKKQVIEKDPTLYLLRRNFASHLYILLDDDERRYIMGHAFSKESQTKRSDFRDEARRYEICKKLALRPLYNDDHCSDDVVLTIGDDPIRYSSAGTETYQIIIPANSSVRISVEAKESFDKLSVSAFSVQPDFIMKTNHPAFESEYMDIIKTYRAAYMR